MAAIRSSAELWRGETGGAGAVVAEEVIQEIDRMNGYVRDLLDYARADATQLSAFDPMTTIATVLSRRDAALRRNHITVQSIDHRDAPSRVLADPMLLEHALTSIVTNAIEAMPEGGALKIAVSRDALERRTDIVVTDTGPGIPEELVARVSESYFTTKSRGLGLGLALAKGVVERWGGSLRISASNAGTIVTLSLKQD
jgi:two-component system sensor histidine kinase HydH